MNSFCSNMKEGVILGFLKELLYIDLQIIWQDKEHKTRNKVLVLRPEFSMLKYILICYFLTS